MTCEGASPLFLRRGGDLSMAGIRVSVDTFRPSLPVTRSEELLALMEAVAERLAAGGRTVVHDKLYGGVSGAAAVDARARAYARRGIDASFPMCHVVCSPCLGGEVAGVQVWSVGTGEASCRTAELHGEPVGRLVERGGSRILMLGSVAAPGLTGRSLGAGRQCAAMFERANAALEAHGFAFGDVARTWIYSARILDWYAELNRVRSAFFREVGLERPGQPFRPPASTGIQGGHPAGAECHLDVLAITGGGGTRPFRPLRTTRQNEAPEYGSAFSRGMGFGEPAGAVLVSGTASIDTTGRTVFENDPQGQVFETYLNTAAVLRDAGASISTGALASVLFFKDAHTWETFREIDALGVLPDLEPIAVYADICREELLFEAEVTAAAPLAGAR